MPKATPKKKITQPTSAVRGVYHTLGLSTPDARARFSQFTEPKAVLPIRTKISTRSDPFASH